MPGETSLPIVFAFLGALARALVTATRGLSGRAKGPRLSLRIIATAIRPISVVAWLALLRRATFLE